MELSLKERFSRFVLLCGLLATIAVIAIINQRLSDDAISLIVGIAIGAGVILLLLVLLGGLVYLVVRGMEARSALKYRDTTSQQPAVLVINPNTQGQLPPATDQPVTWPSSNRHRKFTVIGEE